MIPKTITAIIIFNLLFQVGFDVFCQLLNLLVLLIWCDAVSWPWMHAAVIRRRNNNTHHQTSHWSTGLCNMFLLIVMWLFAISVATVIVWYNTCVEYFLYPIVENSYVGKRAVLSCWLSFGCCLIDWLIAGCFWFCVCLWNCFCNWLWWWWCAQRWAVKWYHFDEWNTCAHCLKPLNERPQQ